MSLLYTIGIIIFGLAGGFLSGYIARTKNHGGHLVCPLGKSCDSVIHSRFSKFFGIENEHIGLVYYTAIAFFYIATLIVPIPQTLVFIVLLITVIAFVFNLHLIVAQLFVLRKWCTTCLFSSAASFMILVMSFLGFESSFGDYLFGLHDVLNWVFVFMVLVGVVTATLHARTFIKFLKDFEISERESDRLFMFSHTGWVAITLAFLSGLALVLTDTYGNITEGSEFMVMVIILGVLIIYEIVVNMFIGPKLIDVHFGDHPELDDHHHAMLRKTSFGFIATGVVSWYMLLLLSTVSFHGYSTLFLLIMYIILVLIAVGVAMYAEHLFYRESLLVVDSEQQE